MNGNNSPSNANSNIGFGNCNADKTNKPSIALT